MTGPSTRTSVHVDVHIPIHPGGHVKLGIDIPDVAATSNTDRQFVMGLVGKLAAWTPPEGEDRDGLPADVIPATQLRGVGRQP